MGCCGKTAKRQTDAAQPRTDQAQTVRLKYTGALVGEFSVLGRATGKTYRMGANVHYRYFDADAADVPFLLARGDVEVAQ